MARKTPTHAEIAAAHKVPVGDVADFHHADGGRGIKVRDAKCAAGWRTVGVGRTLTDARWSAIGE